MKALLMRMSLHQLHGRVYCPSSLVYSAGLRIGHTAYMCSFEIIYFGWLERVSDSLERLIQPNKSWKSMEMTLKPLNNADVKGCKRQLISSCCLIKLVNGVEIEIGL